MALALVKYKFVPSLKSVVLKCPIESVDNTPPVALKPVRLPL